MQVFTEIIINVHHFAEMIMDFVEQKDHFGIRIEFSHEKDELLDTGGGIAMPPGFSEMSRSWFTMWISQSNIDLGNCLKAHQQQWSHCHPGSEGAGHHPESADE